MRKTLFFIFVGFAFLLSFISTDASVSNGTILPGFQTAKVCYDTTCTNKTPGTINFIPSGITPITIADSTGITGKAWGNNLGWIDFKPTGGGVSINPTTGVLSGTAWSQVSGWVNFSVTGQSVSINSNGEFVGYAWTGGTKGGWIKFDCSIFGACVKTDWRPIPYRFQCNDWVDNDTDGLIDFPQDPGCSSATDNDETNTTSTGGGGGGSNVTYSYWYPVNPYTSNSPKQQDDLTTCQPYLLDYIKLGENNNPAEVKKLQEFLNNYQAEKLVVDGVYKNEDFEAVKRFQNKYKSQILNPWKLSRPSGYVYISTVKTINEIVCAGKNLPTEEVKNVCPYFTQYHSLGDTGGDVVKIQKFLNTIFEKEVVTVTGTFDDTTLTAVKDFQKKYSGSILVQWGLSKPTGWWYKTTRKTANKFMGCIE
jgi:peptidoglycan hydrolase-like protein with peptidoglycan-binding domain